MTQQEIGQLVGLGALTIFAVITWRIALLNGKTYARYGREALACCSGIFTLSATTISLSLVGVISPSLSREINLLSFLVALLIMSQTGLATLLELRMERSKKSC